MIITTILAVGASSATASFQPPLQVKSTEMPISVDFCHAAPLYVDYDGDGKKELLVGQLGDGKMRIYRNEGTNKAPKFTDFVWFQAGGEVAFVPAGLCVGFTPQFVDLDGDGVKDIVTGSYTGDTYFFRNEGQGKYAKAQIIKSKSGENLRCGGMSTTGAGDWNGDGKVDLIIQGGNKFVFVPGTGKLAFGDPVPILIGGKQLELRDGVAHAVDWNQDGKLDIVTGDYDGRVAFYPGTGVEQGVPQFGEAVTLVEGLPKNEPAHLALFEYADQEKRLLKNGRSGNRAKVTVADWNDDGKLDLLVGDLLMCKRPERTFTEADFERKKQLEKESMEVQSQWMDILQKLQGQVLEGLGLQSAGQEMTADQENAYMLGFQKALSEDPEHQRVMGLLNKLREELDGYSNNPQYFGFVWVYLQK